MKSNITNNKNKQLFVFFCTLVLLPIAVMCLLGYLLSLLNGQVVESPAMQATVAKLIGVGGLALLYWLITGIKRFWRELRKADEGLKASFAATPTVAAPPSHPSVDTTESTRKQKKIVLPWLKWLRTTLMAMLILAIVALAALALTNPSYEEFKAFTAEHSSTLHRVEWRKVHNYLLWSVYQKDVYVREDREDDPKLVISQQYRGMLLNFTPLP